MTEEPREKLLVFGERDHAVSDVARREHVELLAKAPRAAAVVRHRDDGREPLARKADAVADVGLEPSQERRQARSAADDDDAQPGLHLGLLLKQDHAE